MYETVKAIKLPWNKVSEYIGLEVSMILGRDIVCKANVDDYDYWAAQFLDERIPLSELYKLMETVDAGEEARNESLPESARKQYSGKEAVFGQGSRFGSSRTVTWQTSRSHLDRLLS